MKSFIASICILGLVGMVVGVAVQGADTGTVAATVTPRLLSVSVSPITVGYGVVDVPGVDKAPVTPTTDPVITATNDGNAAEKLNIKGANATGTSVLWTITTAAPGGSPTYNYNHKFGVSPYSIFTAMDTNYATLVASVAQGGTQDFRLRLSTPTDAGADYSVHSTTVTVQAVTP